MRNLQLLRVVALCAVTLFLSAFKGESPLLRSRVCLDIVFGFILFGVTFGSFEEHLPFVEYVIIEL